MGTSASVLDIVRGGNGGQAMEAPRAAPADPNRLRSLVERVVRLETERREHGEDIKDVYLEAKSAGYSP